MSKWDEMTPDKCKEIVASKYQDEVSSDDQPWRLHQAVVDSGHFESVELPGTNGYSDPYVPYFYAEGPECRWWFYPDKAVVWIGVRKTFDRWANSRDFVAGVPQNQEELDWLLAAVKKQVEVGNYGGVCQEKRLAPDAIRATKDAIKMARASREVYDVCLALESAMEALGKHTHYSGWYNTTPPKWPRFC